MARVVIPYTPRYPDVHKKLEAHRFCVLVAHRRFGKTVLSINHLIKMALLCPRERGNFAYVAPLRNQAKVVAWDYLKHYTAVVPGRVTNESELWAGLPNGARIRIFGADNPDALRGMYFDGVVLDEVAQMRPGVWEEIIQPALADRQGWALFIGTPKGINLFSKLWYEALEHQKGENPQWCALSFPVTGTDALPAAEVERQRREMSDNAFRQEFLCDFTASSDNTLMDIELVRGAMRPHTGHNDMGDYPLLLGVDVARSGADATVFFPRRGMVAGVPVVLRIPDNMQVAYRLVDYINQHKPSHVFIDQGQGTGVIDRVRELTRGTPVVIAEIPFGGKPLDERHYLNKRVEMWDKLRQWLIAGGQLPDNAALMAELTTPTFSYDAAGRIKLESKEAIRERLRASTDLADALSLTFALPVPLTAAQQPAVRVEYDVLRYGEEAR